MRSSALLGSERVDEALARYTDIAGRTVQDVVALPGTAEALAAATGRRAVVTSSSGSIAVARLGACGLAPDGPLVSADDVERGKPDPEPFRRGAATMGAAPEAVLAVEDSPAGVDSARAAGCIVVALHHGGDGAALHAADVVVRDLAALRLRGDRRRTGRAARGLSAGLSPRSPRRVPRRGASSRAAGASATMRRASSTRHVTPSFAYACRRWESTV